MATFIQAMNTILRKSWMWAEACALLDEAERKHRRFFELLAVPHDAPAWEPPADIFADGSELNIVVALPGARAEDVAVQMTPAGLQIDTRQANLERGEFVIAPNTYHLIADFLYLQRDLFPQIRDGVHPGGVFVGAILFLESSPFVTGEILHVDGGQIAGH